MAAAGVNGAAVPIVREKKMVVAAKRKTKMNKTALFMVFTGKRGTQVPCFKCIKCFVLEYNTASMLAERDIQHNKHNNKIGINDSS